MGGGGCYLTSVDRKSAAGERPDRMDHRLAFGRKVRELRELAGLSQEAFAELAGLHRTYIGSIERGERNVSIDNIVKIAAALSVTPGALFDGYVRSSKSRQRNVAS